jgi:hypothetical protein
MPSKSAKQKVFFKLCCVNDAFRKKNAPGLTKAQACEWHEADKHQDAQRAEEARKRRATQKD